MIKYTKVIVDSNRNLKGFIAEVSGNKFFTDKNAPVERPFSIEDIVRGRMSNGQISVSKGKIATKPGFSINSLPMTVYNGKEFIDVDNRIKLVTRYVQNNENIGFKVVFGDGSEDNIKYENIIRMSDWFKPDNFVIRTSESGKKYIAGKPGVRLDELPEITLGEKSNAKRTRPAAKTVSKTIVNNLENGYDILDLYNFIADCNGCVINFPTEKYEAVGGKTDNGAFVSYGIGEVASANPKFTSDKINVNAQFKKVGYVPCEIQGNKQKVTTYVFRTKSIFLNGENYINKFGVAVPKENANALLQKIGKSLSISEITDKNVITPLGQVIDTPSELSFFQIDTSKLDLLSVEKRKNSIMTADNIVETCKRRYVANLLTKYTSYKMKEIKIVIGAVAAERAAGNNIFIPFRIYNQDALNAIEAAGINLYTGAYNAPYSPEASKKKSTSASVGETVSIEYILQGFDASKLTGSKIETLANNEDLSKIPKDVIQVVKEVSMLGNPAEQYAMLTKINKRAQAEMEGINKLIWLHIASMYIDGNKQNIHTHDKNDWLPANTRVKTADVYRHSTYESLAIKIVGVSI